MSAFIIQGKFIVCLRGLSQMISEMMSAVRGEGVAEVFRSNYQNIYMVGMRAVDVIDQYS